MVILLIGPSGAGKSTLGRAHAIAHREHRYVELDKEIREKYPEAFRLINSGISAREYFEATTKILAETDKSTEEIVLVDVGAGSIEDPRAIALVGSSNYRSVAICPSVETAYERASKRPHSRWSRDPIEKYREIEFSPNRIRIYNSASVCLANEGEQTDDKLKLERIILQIARA